MYLHVVCLSEKRTWFLNIAEQNEEQYRSPNYLGDLKLKQNYSNTIYYLPGNIFTSDNENEKSSREFHVLQTLRCVLVTTLYPKVFYQ